jgi:hypothetical protein
MPFDGQLRIIRLHAFPVVFDAHLLLAAEFHVNGDAPGAGIDGVFDEFFHHRGGTLDDFAGGDLIGEIRG